MGALDRVFRGRRPSQERPLAAIIAGLWKNGEQGVWYDPSNLATMFQDAAGTLPVYAPGQGQVDPPVGRILDKSGRGNHAYQTTTTSRPTLSARYNQLTGTESLATQSVTVVATAYTLTTAGPGSVTLSGAASGTYTAGSRMVTCTAGALTLTVLGSVTQADLRPANDGAGLPPYQRVVDATTYDTVGFPLYLRFDGVDDWMQTASIDFSGSDKILFAAAVRKERDALVGVICELSVEKNANTGVVALLAPGANGLATFVWASKGTVEALATATGMPSPISAVLVGLGDISGKISRLRVNGSIIANNAGNQGTGNYGNYPLYIGRRGGTSLPFGGRIYGLLIRGAATSNSTINNVERHLNQKAKVF